jgi:hypothetical protein
MKFYDAFLEYTLHHPLRVVKCFFLCIALHWGGVSNNFNSWGRVTRGWLHNAILIHGHKNHFFCSRFHVHLAPKFAKRANVTQIFFFSKKSIWVSKNAEFFPDFRFVKKLQKHLPLKSVCPKADQKMKVLKKTFLNKSKSFWHIIFFVRAFLVIFILFELSTKFCVF